MPKSTDTLRIVDNVLTSIVNSYENRSMVANFLFHRVSLSGLSTKVVTFGKSMFIKRELHRALRGASNRIDPTDFDTIDVKLLERDIELALDILELDEAAINLQYEMRVTKELQDVLLLGREVEAANLAQTAGTWAAPHDVAAGWATPASGTPIADIKAQSEVIRAATSRKPNVMIIAPDSYEAALLCDEVTGKITYTGAGTNQATLSIFKELTEIDNIYVGYAKQSIDAESTIPDIWTNSCVIAYVDQADKANRSKFNPSMGYEFFKQGFPQVDTYYEVGGKVKVIRNTDIYLPKIINNSAGVLLWDTVTNTD